MKWLMSILRWPFGNRAERKVKRHLQVPPATGPRAPVVKVLIGGTEYPLRW